MVRELMEDRATLTADVERLAAALAAAQAEVERLKAALAEVESYRRGLGQTKLIDGLPAAITAELKSLRAVRDAAAEVLAHYGSNVTKAAVAMDQLGAALGRLPPFYPRAFYVG